MKSYNFVSTRELKNNTNKILHAAEHGSTIIVTRYGKPVATLKSFQEDDLKESKNLSLYQKVKQKISNSQPQLCAMTKEELRSINENLSAKVTEFPTWQEMDRAAKGDDYGLSR